MRELGWYGDVNSDNYFDRLITTEEGAVFLIAEEAEKIVGVVFGEYSIKEDWSELMGIGVKEDFRRKGIGSELIKKFEEIVSSKGISMIELYAHIDTLAKSIHKLGYEKGDTYISFSKDLKK